MAPKKNAKRVIQVPEEEEPPAKKLQVTLKRHGVDQKLYKRLADVFSHPAAANLTQDCKEMCLAMMPFSICAASDERNELQQAAVELLEKVISQCLAGMQDSLEAEAEKLRAMDVEKAQLEEALRGCEAALKDAQANTSQGKAALAKAGEACLTAKANLKAAKDAETAQQLTTSAAADDKEKLQEVLSSTGSFARLKNGDFEEGEVDKLYKLLEPVVLQKLRTDSSLKTAMRCTLVKRPADRGPFDALLLQELEKAFADRIAALDADLAAAGPLAGSLKAAVETAAADLESATTSEQEADRTASTLRSAETAPAAALAAAKAAFAEFTPKHAQASCKRSFEQKQLQNFVDLNVAAFHELRDRKSAKLLKEAAAKADALKSKSCAKADATAPLSMGNASVADQQESKLVAQAEAIASSMLSPRKGETAAALPEVGGA